MRNIKNEIWVGIFMIIALLSILFIFFKVTNINFFKKNPTYKVSAVFDNIGGLKLNSPVKIGGVVIGRVTEIKLDPKTFLPKVIMNINKIYNRIPDNSSLTICTFGLIGEQYLSLNIGFEDKNIGTSILKDGSIIENTKSAVILEDLIGQLFYSNYKKQVN